MLVQVIDFGLAAIWTPGKLLRMHCGSPSYAAPEIVARKMYEGPPVDVWSLGVVLHAMLCGRLPFVGTKGDKQASPACWALVSARLATLGRTRCPRGPHLTCGAWAWCCTPCCAAACPSWTPRATSRFVQQPSSLQPVRPNSVLALKHFFDVLVQ